MTIQHQDFADLFFDRAARKPSDIAYRFHSSGQGNTVDLSMAALAEQVRGFAAGLQRRGLTGERIVLALPHGPDFIVALYGCFAAGAVAVPVPQQRSAKEDARFNSVVVDAEPALIVVDAAAQPTVARNVEASCGKRGLRAPEVVTVEQVGFEAAAFRQSVLGPKALALLQYTSGSTGDPKGVMISHGNFLANCDLIVDTLQIHSQSAGVLWLPFYHDMGLVGAVLVPMFCEARVDLMTPQEFLRSPMNWLKRLSNISATMTAAPNFALERCCDLATPEIINSLDLSPLRCLLTGSEPVNANTLERFAVTFAPCGFKADAYLPAYGLAEATLMATGTLKHGRGPTIMSLDARALAAGEAKPAVALTATARFVGNGTPGGIARIVDPETSHEVAQGTIGEIWITGPSIAQGYWAKPELTEQAFHARIKTSNSDDLFYRTGDLGFVLDDDLYITGRIKDLIIIRGRNIYPQDIEEVATRNQPLLLTGAAAAFATTTPVGEELVFMSEASLDSVRALRDEKVAAVLVSNLLQRLSDAHEVVPAEIMIVRPGRLPRTSSGKIRRSTARKQWEDAGFEDAMVYRWRRPSDNRPAVSDTTDKSRRLSRAEVENWLLDRLANHSGQPKHMIDLNEPFASYGLDSLTAVEMIEAVNKLNTGARAVDAIDLFDYPTIAQLLDHMFSESHETAAKVAPASHVSDSKSDLQREADALAALLGD